MAVSRTAADRVGLLDDGCSPTSRTLTGLCGCGGGARGCLRPGRGRAPQGLGVDGRRRLDGGLYYSTRNTILVAERARPLPAGLRALRRGVVVGTHLAQAVSHPDRRAAMRAVLEGRRDARRQRRRAKLAVAARRIVSFSLSGTGPGHVETAGPRRFFPAGRGVRPTTAP
jgi:hypothetical protein